MRKYLLAAVAVAAIASPAVASGPGPYVGIEGGILFPRNNFYDINGTDGTTAINLNNALQVNYKEGYDVDGIAGFGFGMFRLEAELGYKRAKVNYVSPETNLQNEGFTQDDFPQSGRISAWSLMGNALADFHLDERTSLYAGAGAGGARIKTFGAHDNVFAWQLIAGVKTAVTDNIDIGVKYRYFQTARYKFNDDDFDTGISGSVGDKFHSHSVLASLIFSFGSPPAPPPPPAPVIETPPPPPPPPATQTCPDGSVILATDVCPAPPPPPPPAPPAAGERG